MAGARRSVGSNPGRGGGVLPAASMLLLALFVASFCPTMARAGELGANDQLVLAALAGAQPLPIGEMAKEAARGLGGGTEAGVHIPITEPAVRLWDDFGAFSPSSIGNTSVAINTGGSGQ
jgi:hypothetical protein